MSVNKVILIGRLGKDPEIRYMPNNDPVATFSLATSAVWKKDGQKQEKTEWHSIVLFRSLASIAHQYLKKGNLVYIEGKIQSRKYLSKEGIERVNYEIIGDSLRMLGSKNDNINNNDNTSTSNSTPVQQENTIAKNDINIDTVVDNLDDDDIPF